MRKFYVLRITSILTITLLAFFKDARAQNWTIAVCSGGPPSSTVSTTYGPMYSTSTANANNRTAVIYPASQLATLAGTLLDTIYFHRASATGSMAGTPNLKIYLKQVSNTDWGTASLTWSTEITGATLVFNGDPSAIVGSSAGWKGFPLSASFAYSGSQNLAVFTEYSNTTASTTINWSYEYTSPCVNTSNSNTTKYNNNTTGTLSATLGSTNYRRPYIGFDYTLPACTNPPTPGTAITSQTPVCSGSSVTLDLTGNSIGSSQTYQWESSPSNSPFTPTSIGTVSASTSLTINPTASLWYRAKIICSSGTPVYSTAVQVLVTPAFAGGIYTINAALPTGSTNFQTFAAAVTAISCGITGPVVFNVSPGTYNEQIVIPQINNTSATNTIRFNGNGATLSSSPSVSTNRTGIVLNGADHVIIDSLTVDVSGGTYGWGILLTNQADSNQIIDNTIITSTSSTSSNYAGILINGSVSSTSSSGNNGNGNLISGNTIRGGYYGLQIYGSTAPYNQTNTISNNTVRDFYFYGIYNYGNNNLKLYGNDISRPTRTSVTTTYGIYVATNSNVLVEKNRIHDLFAALSTNTTSTTYSLYMADDGTAAEPNRLQNNVVYSIKKSNGTVYGIYVPNYDYWKIFHNTIVLDDTLSTAGTTDGIYAYGASDSVYNNIVYITRGGTGTKHLLNYNTSTAASIPASDYNDLFLSAPAGSNYTGRVNATDYGTLATWQTANGGTLDQQSQAVNPNFANPNSGDLYPNNSVLANTGTGVGVADDITGFVRSPVTPTPGAYEIVPSLGVDVGAFNLVAPVQKQCYSSSETVTVKITNYSANTHNFSVKPVAVNASVTGPNPTTFSAVTINSGTLAPNASLNVIISNNYNMSAGGTYVFSASTFVSGDANVNNDAMNPETIIDTTLSAGSVSANPPSYCVTGGTPTLALTGGGGGTIQWQQSATGLAGSWVNVGGNTTSYTPAAAITSTMYYRAYRSCSGNADTTAIDTVAVNNPQILTTVPGVRCGPGTVSLSATGSPGATFNWYANATGGTPLFTGSSFTTPILNGTTTYYVAATSGGSTTNAGAPNTAISTSLGSQTSVNTVGINFNVLTPATINSVVIYPTAAVGSSFTIVVKQGSTVVATYSGVTTVSGPTTAPVAQTVPLNFSLPAGTGYLMAFSTNPGVIRNSGGDAFPYTIPNVISLTSSTLSGFYYYFYNWQVSTGCESARQAITATVNSSPAFNVTADLTVCNNSVTAINVTSPLANFNSYTWSPAAGLYTDAAASIPYASGSSASVVYIKTATPGTYTYIATANNTTTSCQNIDSLRVTVLPASVTVLPSSDQLCVSGTTTLSLSPNAATFGAAQFQWSGSTNNISYTPVPGATNPNFTTPVITATTYYKVDIKNSAGQVCLSPHDTVKVNNPQLLSTTPAALCGPGVMTISATTNAGSTVNWYNASTGGSLLGTGNNFTTPSLSTTTTYYAAAVQGGGTSDVGVKISDFAICGSPVSSTATGYALRFTTTKPVTINSVYVIPQSTSLTIALRASGSTTNIISQAFTFNASQVGTPVQINLGWQINSAGNYQLVNTTGGLWRITTLGCGYPFTSTGGGFVITGSATSSTGNPSTTYYNGFYQLNITEACESARTAVVAQISSNTAITANPIGNVSTCVGSTLNLSVQAVGANLSYQWRKNGVNIAGATNDTLSISPVSLTDAGTYDVVITGLCGPAVTSGVSIVNVSAANTWLGAVSSDWNNANNWCGGIPNATSNVEVFPGTPYQPVVSTSGANVKTLTINIGAIVIVAPGDSLNIYGDFINNGTFNASNATLIFAGASNQNIDGMTVGNMTVNGAGITLNGTATVNQVLNLMNGKILLGINNLSVTTIQNGNASSYVVTNSTGSLIVRNLGASAVNIPVGPSITSYNPVSIANGGNRDYSIRVSIGITPGITKPSIAVNRVWTISPNTAPSSPVTITVQYQDAHMNAQGMGANTMEIGVHNGTSWTIVNPAVLPGGSASARTVTTTTTQLGPIAVSNVGGISWITAVMPVDPAISRMILMPNVVKSSAMLRITSLRSAKMNLQIIDAKGRIVMNFNSHIMTGQTDLHLEVGKLAAGTYSIQGFTDKGKTATVRFVKL